MANLDSSSIANGGTIEASHITNLYDALTGTTTYDNILLVGTASVASSAVSASYASTSTSASYALTSTSASYALTSTSAGTATSATSATSASYASTSTSASYAVTASYALNGGGGGTGDAITDGTKTLDFDGSSNLQTDTTFLPTVDDTYDLGSATKKWRDLYLGASSIYMSGSGGWMTGSFDGTNLNINGNALIKSSVTSSMSVSSANSSTTSLGFIPGGDAVQEIPLVMAAGGATLTGGTVQINNFETQLQPKRIGIDCFITVTDSGGATSGRYTVSMAEGRITISELAGGTSNGDINYIIMYTS